MKYMYLRHLSLHKNKVEKTFRICHFRYFNIVS